VDDITALYSRHWQYSSELDSMVPTADYEDLLLLLVVQLYSGLQVKACVYLCVTYGTTVVLY